MPQSFLDPQPDDSQYQEPSLLHPDEPTPIIDQSTPIVEPQIQPQPLPQPQPHNYITLFPIHLRVGGNPLLASSFHFQFHYSKILFVTLLL